MKLLDNGLVTSIVLGVIALGLPRTGLARSIQAPPPAATRSTQAMQDMSAVSVADSGTVTASSAITPRLQGPPLTLEELQRIALESNPTLRQANALIEAAEGRRIQAGLWPNPAFGYNTEDATPAQRGGQQGIIFQQTIVTGHKLRLAQDIAFKEKLEAAAQARIQSYRVLNAVAIAYYDALAARRVVKVRQQLLEIADRAVNITRDLMNVGQADKPDLLQAQVEANLAQVALAEAVNEEAGVWRELAAVVAEPNLELHPLAGSLDHPLPELDGAETLKSILAQSPEVTLAELGVNHAEAVLARARVEPVPNINFIAGPWVNFERPSSGSPIVGPAAVAQITVTMPIFDRNQGSIAAAKANIRHEHDEITRVKLELRARFAPVYALYRTTLVAAKRYQTEILPATEQAYRLYLTRYEQMAAAYPQVLIAQRTMAQAHAEYISALRHVWSSTALLRGMLLSGGLTSPQRPQEVLTRPVSAQSEIVRTFVPGE